MSTTTTCDKCGAVISGWPLTLIIDEKPRPTLGGLNSSQFQLQQSRQDKIRRIDDLCETCAKRILEPYPREAQHRTVVPQ
jgi:hypothetical protein